MLVKRFAQIPTETGQILSTAPANGNLNNSVDTHLLRIIPSVSVG